MHKTALIAGALALAVAAQAAHAQGTGKQRAARAQVGCSAHLRVAADEDAFRQSGVEFTPASIAQFRTRAAAVFRTAADRLCSAGLLRPSSLRRYSTLLLVPGAGAAQAAFYDDPEQSGRGVLHFQWAGFEEEFAIPERADIQMGLRCWADPRMQDCDDRRP